MTPRLPLPEVASLEFLRAMPAAYYTVNDMARMWLKQPAAIRWWLLFLRRDGQAPTAAQTERKRRNMRRGGRTAYRADYVKLVEECFMSQIRPSPRRAGNRSDVTSPP